MQMLTQGIISVAEAATEAEKYLRVTARPLREALDGDKARKFTECAEALTDAVETKDTRGEWTWLKRVLRLGGRQPARYKNSNVLPYRLDEHGEVRRSHQAPVHVEYRRRRVKLC